MSVPRWRLPDLLAASSFLLAILVSPAAAQLLGPEFQVNSYTTNYQRRPGIAADGSGNFVVVWESNGQDGSGRGVFGQRYDSAGLRVGSEFQVNGYTTSYQDRPAVAADGSGNFVVVWTAALARTVRAAACSGAGSTRGAFRWGASSRSTAIRRAIRAHPAAAIDASEVSSWSGTA